MDQVGNIIMYFVIALSIIVFSVLTVTTSKILRSATYLLFVLLATAGIYFQVGYEFLGAVQIAVYAGGILVLFVFAILLTHKPEEKAKPLTSHKRWLGLSAAIAGVLVCAYALIARFGASCATEGVKNVDIDRIGHALLSTDKFGYLLPFEAVSVLLMACIIGGIVIARKR
ncbi:MAG: NADH-quinone oxidoreductase subunit J [Muribaculaceae bacterium]